MEKKQEKAGIAWESVLGVGESAAVSGQELTRRLGYSDTRQTRRAVMAARMRGVPICSLQNAKNTGYFLPDASNLEGLRHTVRELRRRAFSSLMQASRLGKWADMHGEFEQMSIAEFLEKGEIDERPKEK